MDYESGKSEPDLDMLKTTASALRIEKTALYDEYYHFLDHPFAIRVKEVRQRAGLTQKQLASLLGVGESAVRDWENGRKRTTREVFNKMKKSKLLQ